MTREVIERVALAMQEAIEGPIGDFETGAFARPHECYMVSARAAIGAMRDPSVRMMTAVDGINEVLADEIACIPGNSLHEAYILTLAEEALRARTREDCGDSPTIPIYRTSEAPLPGKQIKENQDKGRAEEFDIVNSHIQQIGEKIGTP